MALHLPLGPYLPALPVDCPRCVRLYPVSMQDLPSRSLFAWVVLRTSLEPLRAQPYLASAIVPAHGSCSADTFPGQCPLCILHMEFFKPSQQLCLYYSDMYSTKGELLPQVCTAHQQAHP